MRHVLVRLCAAAAVALLGTALLSGSALAKAPKPKIKKVVFTGTPAEPTVTVTGVGLGSLPIAEAEPAPECFGGPLTGDDFGEAAWIEDPTQGWTAGQDGDCIGLSFSSYTETEVIFHLGSGYVEYSPMQKKDHYKLSLNSLSKEGKVSFKKVV